MLRPDTLLGPALLVAPLRDLDDKKKPYSWGAT
jgi:hypothetical protein